MTDKVKYLIVTLDKKLDWKAHLENRMRKACTAYWQCRRAVGKTCESSPNVVAWLYILPWLGPFFRMLRWYGGGEWS
jgi:hypothetical protein